MTRCHTGPLNPERRRFCSCVAGLAFSVADLPVAADEKDHVVAAGSLSHKIIPSTGEILPAIRMGTWITFDVGNVPTIRRQRADVLQTFFDLGGRMIDSSPMYGYAEEVIGNCLRRTGCVAN